VAPLQGDLVRLRRASAADIPRLVEIRRTPEVYARWRGGDDIVAAVKEDFAEPGIVAYVIELEGRVVGWIQWQAEEDPDYRHASIDIYVDPALVSYAVGIASATRDPVAYGVPDLKDYIAFGASPRGPVLSSSRGRCRGARVFNRR